jgi:hypothetical protein
MRFSSFFVRIFVRIFARIFVRISDARIATASIALLAILVAVPLPSRAEEETFVLGYEPPAAEWELARDPNRPDARIWKSLKNEKEHLRIEVLRGAADSAGQIRMALDEPGKASCARFDTTTIRESSVNGYPHLVWRTDCERADGAKTTLLQLVIRGRDAIHLAIKSWPGGAASADFETWLGRFQRAFVCDTRRPAQACPQGVGGGGA